MSIPWDVARCWLQLALWTATVWAWIPIRQRPTCVKHSFDRLLQFKVLACVALIATHAAPLWSQFEPTVSDTRRRALLESGSLLLIMYQKHKRDVSSSTLISLYLPASATVELLAMSPPWLSLYPVSVVAALSLALKISIMILHECSKWEYLTEDAQSQIGTENASGFWSRCLALHFTPVLRNGSKREINYGDISSVSPELMSSKAMQKFEAIWGKYKPSRNGLIRACIRVERYRLVTAIISGVFATMLHTCIPLLIGFIVETVEERATQGPDTPAADRLLLMAVAIFAGESILQGNSLRCLVAAKTTTRGVLLGSIFKSITRLSDSKLSATAKSSVIATAIPLGSDIIHVVYGMIIYTFQSIACALLLWFTLGIRTLWIMLLTFGATSVGFYVGKALPKRLTKQQEATVARSNISANLLRNIQSIRLLGLEEQLKSTIVALQDEELQTYSKFAREKGKRQILVMSYMPLVGLFAFSNDIFPSIPNDPNTHLAKFFVSLALANELCFAIAMLTQVVALLLPTVGKCRIVQDLLRESDRNSPENLFNRLIRYENMYNNSVVAGEVDMEDVTSAFVEGGAPVLHDVDIYLPRGSTTVVTGPIGCGKTTLLNTIAGRTTILEGSRHISNAEIAYSHQIPWLQDRSIRDNIVGPNDFDLEWYNAAKTACSLNHDIALLPLADDFVVGVKGCNLSRSLQQRISLARVAYSKAPVVLLDDPLSAQEKPVADQLVEEVFGHYGILRPVTVILTSSKPLPFSLVATHAMRIDPTGVAREISTRRLLELGVIASQPVTNDPENIPQEPAPANHSGWELLATPVKNNMNHRRFRYAERDQTAVQLCYNNTDRGLVMIAFIISLLTIVLESFPSIMLRVWFASTTSKPFPVIYCIIASALTGFMYFTFNNLWWYRINRQFAKNTLQYLLNIIIKISISSLDTVRSEAIINIFNEAMQLITCDIFSELRFVIMLVNTILICWGIIISCNPILVFAFIIFMACLVGMKSLQQRASRQLLQLNLASEDRLRIHFDETVTGSSQIQLLNWEERHGRWSTEHIDQSLATFYNSATANSWLVNATNISTIPLGLAFVAASVYLNIAPHYVGLSLITMLEIFKISITYIPQWYALEISLASLDRIQGFFRKSPLEETREDYDLPTEWPANGDVRVEGASIWKGARIAGDEQPLLENVTFDTTGHRNTGIHGDCDRSRNAMLLSLLGQVAYTGSIKVGGVEVSSISPRTMLSNVTIVPSTSILFPGSIRQNLLPHEILVRGNEAAHLETLEQVLTGLSLWDVINAQGGLAQQISKIRMTPNQLQRFALAQALMAFHLKRTSLVMMNGTTSDVNHDSHLLMRAIMRNMLQNSSVITSAKSQYAIQGTTMQVHLDDGAARITAYSTD